MLGNKIKDFLEKQGIKQSFVCEKTNFSAATLSSMLNGNRKITAEEYFKICNALNVNVDFFAKVEADEST